MRVVFVGGTRFMGHHAAVQALARGHEVTMLHRGVHHCEVPGVDEVRVERGDPSALAVEVARAHPDVVIDTFAMTRADGQALAMIARIACAPLIVLSSVDVYAAWGAVLGHAPAAPGVIDERSPLTHVVRPYAGRGHDGGEEYDKKDVEAEVAASGVPTCVLRLPAVYGPRDYRRRFGEIVDAIDAGVPVSAPGGPTWRCAHADARDVAHAIVLAAEASRGAASSLAIYNVAEALTPTMAERVAAIADAIRKPVRWCDGDERLPDIVVDSTRIRRALGFAEVTTAESRVDDLIAACRATRIRLVT